VHNGLYYLWHNMIHRRTVATCSINVQLQQPVTVN